MSAYPATAPFYFVINAGAGRNDAADTQDKIHSVLSESGREHDITLVEDPQHLAESARHTVEHAKERGGAIVAVGGDGTLNTVAQLAVDHEVPFGVIQQGTFNYFGRTHGIPSDTAEAASALLTGHIQRVQVGYINDRLFLVNAAVGLYPEILEDRETFKQKFGRSRFNALFAGAGTVLREHRQLLLRIEHEGVSRSIKTATLFVGNNRLQLERIGIGEAPLLESGQLVALLTRPMAVPTIIWLMLRGAIGQLGEASHVDTFGLRQMTVKPAMPYGSLRMKVAIDGEVTWLRAPLHFRAAPGALQLLVPGPKA